MSMMYFPWTTDTLGEGPEALDALVGRRVGLVCMGGSAELLEFHALFI